MREQTNTSAFPHILSSVINDNESCVLRAFGKNQRRYAIRQTPITYLRRVLTKVVVKGDQRKVNRVHRNAESQRDSSTKVTTFGERFSYGTQLWVEPVSLSGELGYHGSSEELDQINLVSQSECLGGRQTLVLVQTVVQCQNVFFDWTFSCAACS